MMREDIPWAEFKNIEHADEAVYVRADMILGIERRHSGVNLLMVGGGIQRVRGNAEAVKEQLDAFWVTWCAGEERRRREFDAKVQAEIAKP